MAGGVEHFFQASRISFSAQKRSCFLLTAAFGIGVRATDGRQKRAVLFGRKDLRGTCGETAL
jgi:hypothetical protein